MSEPSPFYEKLPSMEDIQQIAPKQSSDDSMSRDLEYLYDDLEQLVTQIRLDDPSALRTAEDLRDSLSRLLR